MVKSEHSFPKTNGLVYPQHDHPGVDMFNVGGFQGKLVDLVVRSLLFSFLLIPSSKHLTPLPPPLAVITALSKAVGVSNLQDNNNGGQ